MAFSFLTEPASIGRSPCLGSGLCTVVYICVLWSGQSPLNLRTWPFWYTYPLQHVTIVALDTRVWSLESVAGMSSSRPEKPKPGPPWLLGTQVPSMGRRYPTHRLLLVCTRRVDLHARGLGWGSTIFCSCVVTRRDQARVHMRQPVHPYHVRLSDPRLGLRCTRVRGLTVTCVGRALKVSRECLH